MNFGKCHCGGKAWSNGSYTFSVSFNQKNDNAEPHQYFMSFTCFFFLFFYDDDDYAYLLPFSSWTCDGIICNINFCSTFILDYGDCGIVIVFTSILFMCVCLCCVFV